MQEPIPCQQYLRSYFAFSFLLYNVCPEHISKSIQGELNKA